MEAEDRQAPSNTQASGSALASAKSRTRRTAGVAFRRTTRWPVTWQVLMNKWIALLSKKVSCAVSRTIAVPGTTTASILSWRSWMVPMSTSPRKTSALPPSRLTKKAPGPLADMAPPGSCREGDRSGGRRTPRRRWRECTPNEVGSWTYLEPDLLAAPLGFDAPRRRDGVHEEQAPTTHRSRIRPDWARIKRRPRVYDLASDTVVQHQPDD